MSAPLLSAVPDWVGLLREGDRIACSQMTAEPRALLSSLAAALAAGEASHPASVFLGTPFSLDAGAMPKSVKLQVWGGMGAALALSRDRRLDVFPENYSNCAALFRDGRLRADVVLVSLARHDRTGGLYLGASHGFIIEAARRARIVVAEVNDEAPCIAGGEWPDEICIGATFETRYALAQPKPTAVGDVDRKIADGISEQVSDGATIQVGIGGLGAALGQSLRGHRHLGIHSGLLTNALWSLVEVGAVDNSRKQDHRGASVCSAIYGDGQMYRTLSNDTRVRIATPEFTHGASSLAKLPSFTAINTALEVDLLGQVNSESISGRYVGGVGGLNDFVRGALASAGGRSIIAIPTRRTASSHRASGVVARISGPATVCAADADIFVSEYGMASIRGCSRRERAARLIAIAHPDDRAQLEVAARELGLD